MTDKLDEMDERTFRGMTGLTRAAFAALLVHFSAAFLSLREEQYRQQSDKRQRQPGGGQKGRLVTMEAKLYFILYYLRCYPTFDELGLHFDLDRSNAHRNVQALLAVLLRALAQCEVLPERQFADVEALQAAFADVTELLIDATERPVQRSQDEDTQRAHYSGKKKRHSVKNTVISSASCLILFLGYTVVGSQHDYGLFKQEFAPQQDWFSGFKVWVDLGYLGFANDYSTLELHIPYKKPRKSKTNPTPTLTADQLAHNQEVSSFRVRAEHAIRRMKRFRSLTDTFRNRTTAFADQLALAAAGLANWWQRVVPATAA